MPTPLSLLMSTRRYGEGSRDWWVEVTETPATCSGAVWCAWLAAL